MKVKLTQDQTVAVPGVHTREYKKDEIVDMPEANAKNMIIFKLAKPVEDSPKEPAKPAPPAAAPAAPEPPK